MGCPPAPWRFGVLSIGGVVCASPLLHDEGDCVSSAIDVAETRTAAPGLGFPRLSGPATTPLGWPASDRVSRETSLPDRPAMSRRRAWLQPPPRTRSSKRSRRRATRSRTPRRRPPPAPERTAWTPPPTTTPRCAPRSPRRCPGPTSQTPLAAAVAADARKRITLSGRTVPRPAHTRVHDGGEPEGWRRQDDDHGQHRGRPGPGRQHGPRHRPRPAGQRQHRPGHRAPRRGAERLRRARRGPADRRRRPGVPRHPGPVLRARHDRPRRRRDRAGLARRARDPPAEGRRRPTSTSGRRRGSGSTTCSSTARPAWACSR